jgi:hypothetical protein
VGRGAGGACQPTRACRLCWSTMTGQMAMSPVRTPPGGPARPGPARPGRLFAQERAPLCRARACSVRLPSSAGHPTEPLRALARQVRASRSAHQRDRHASAGVGGKGMEMDGQRQSSTVRLRAGARGACAALNRASAAHRAAGQASWQMQLRSIRVNCGSATAPAGGDQGRRQRWFCQFQFQFGCNSSNCVSLQFGDKLGLS